MIVNILSLLYYVQTGIFIRSIFVFFFFCEQYFKCSDTFDIFFWQLVNKTSYCFNNIVSILVAKISSKKVFEKMENNLTLEKVLLVCNRNAELERLVGATFDWKLASPEGWRRKIWKFWQVCDFLFYFFVVIDVWVVKNQLRVFWKLQYAHWMYLWQCCI